MLEQTKAIEMLQNKPCPKIHGMTPEEREEYERVKAEAEESHDENYKLSQMMADLSAENVRLRNNIRSKATSSSTSSTDTSSSKNSKLSRQLEEVSAYVVIAFLDL
jgi:predicted  nucleic acid-binding Zn-ribbon protein